MRDDLHDKTKEDLRSGVGAKDDLCKERFSLIPPEFLFALAELYRRGELKYSARNWENGMNYERLFDALNRHAWAWWAGQEDDPDTAMQHLVAVAWNAIALYTLHVRGKGTDDRPECAATFRNYSDAPDRSGDFSESTLIVRAHKMTPDEVFALSEGFQSSPPKADLIPRSEPAPTLTGNHDLPQKPEA